MIRATSETIPPKWYSDKYDNLKPNLMPWKSNLHNNVSKMKQVANAKKKHVANMKKVSRILMMILQRG